MADRINGGLMRSGYRQRARIVDPMLNTLTGWTLSEAQAGSIVARTANRITFGRGATVPGGSMQQRVPTSHGSTYSTDLQFAATGLTNVTVGVRLEVFDSAGALLGTATNSKVGTLFSQTPTFTFTPPTTLADPSVVIRITDVSPQTVGLGSTDMLVQALRIQRL